MWGHICVSVCTIYSSNAACRNQSTKTLFSLITIFQISQIPRFWHKTLKTIYEELILQHNTLEQLMLRMVSLTLAKQYAHLKIQHYKCSISYCPIQGLFSPSSCPSWPGKFLRGLLDAGSDDISNVKLPSNSNYYVDILRYLTFGEMWLSQYNSIKFQY